MKIRSMLAMPLLVLCTSMNVYADGLEERLKKSSKGSGKISYGAYGQLGYANIDSVTAGDTKYFGRGLDLEFGGYAMFNGLRDMVDAEVGLGYHINGGTGNENLDRGEVSYDSKGFKIYGSIAFQLPNKHAVAVGAFKDFGSDISTKSRRHDLDSSGWQGLYAEYQMFPDIINKQMAYVRLSIGNMPLDITNRDGSFSESPRYVGLSIGYKYKAR